MSRVARKPVFGVYDQVRHKPGCTDTEGNYVFRKKRDCTICVANTKALISFEVIAQLNCVFVFACAKSWFSHDAAQMIYFIFAVALFDLVQDVWTIHCLCSLLTASGNLF